MTTTHVLGEVEARLVARERMTRADVQRIFSCPDLVSIGIVGETARRNVSGARITFGRVLEVAEVLPPSAGDAGEVRLVGAPTSVEELRARVSAAVAWAGDRVVTGFTAADLARLCNGDLDALTRLASDLATAGLTAVAEVEADRAASDEELIAQVRAIVAGGLAAPRLTVSRAERPDVRMALIERACALQEATRAFKAFAPLPRLDLVETPSTGYDDVKTVAAARVRCADIELIQVDWPLYGPKLAQVAITFGANDIDGVAAVDQVELGPRRAAVEDIRRQIRAADGDPAERDGAYRTRG
jgi:hypothetical protein